MAADNEEIGAPLGAQRAWGFESAPTPEEHAAALRKRAHVDLLEDFDGAPYPVEVQQAHRLAVEPLLQALAEIRALSDRGVAWSIQTRSQVVAIAEAALGPAPLSGSQEADRG